MPTTNNSPKSRYGRNSTFNLDKRTQERLSILKDRKSISPVKLPEIPKESKEVQCEIFTKDFQPPQKKDHSKSEKDLDELDLVANRPRGGTVDRIKNIIHMLELDEESVDRIIKYAMDLQNGRINPNDAIPKQRVLHQFSNSPDGSENKRPGPIIKFSDVMEKVKNAVTFGNLKHTKLHINPYIAPNLLPKLGNLVVRNLKNKSNMRYKHIFWDNVPANAIKNTVWEKADPNPYNIDFSDLEPIFTIEGSPDLQSLVTDPDRAYKMNLMLTKFQKFTIEDLRNAIFSLNESILDMATLDTILEFAPTPEEISVAALYDSGFDDLDSASLFILGIYDIPFLKERLQGLRFKHQFKDRQSKLLENINIIASVSKAVTDSVSFQKFLKTALGAGNVLNQESARGNIAGLKLNTLLALLLTKGKYKNSAFTYLLKKLHSHNVRNLSFVEEFFQVKEASDIKIQELHDEITKLQNNVDDLNRCLEQAKKLTTPDTSFSSCFSSFCKSSQESIKEAEKKLKEALEHFANMMKFYGQDPAIETHKFFLSLSDFNSCVREWINSEEERIKFEAKRKVFTKN